ncbi:cAMP-binding domain of CRP or a regulatory subunit of cAMP-dependent protein kinases [Sphingomonas guangdongensis]|uniref:cAMP-binding domain of CRP or a regulatory subunit of cAMP-dependent protein kinases n=1 Tax=Sphingomonas guangdongensis TaxID=1141890 RepID=A0A285R0Z2_9SPHN|nr:Crp/Fnr family transcriptional regulator [Sphingomonas guangdongensis]SOB87773.1 cAMP-binding domain of CRP or a regulatory subunit of cAMP-dependent protein kinases [Sphingomonas guangdongensis]
MKSGLFLRGRRRQQLSGEEQRALEDAISDVKRVPARTLLVRANDQLQQSMLLLSGFACRYMDDRTGQRQLLSVHVPGDFLDLHGFPLVRLDHDIATLTAVEIATVPHARLMQLVQRFPHLARLLWFSTLLDAAMHREWIFRLGRLDAAGRVAHLLCETHERLRAVGMAADDSFDFPLTQQDIGEACGLTSVHANRTVARLRTEGLATVARRKVQVHDQAQLLRLAEFAPDYLYLDDLGGEAVEA